MRKLLVKVTRAIIKYLIRRRIAGATFRAQASHLLNRMATFFGADGPAEDGNAPRPGFRHGAEAERGYDTFDDAYTRFAGRGCRGGVVLTWSSFRRSMIWNIVLSFALLFVLLPHFLP